MDVFNDLSNAFPEAILKEIMTNIKKWDKDPEHSLDPYADVKQSKLFSV